MRIKECAAASGSISGCGSELPALYLDLGATLADRLRVDEAADHLRKCIRLAAKLGQKQTHADARLELGDLLESKAI